MEQVDQSYCGLVAVPIHHQKMVLLGLVIQEKQVVTQHRCLSLPLKQLAQIFHILHPFPLFTFGVYLPKCPLRLKTPDIVGVAGRLLFKLEAL